MVNVTFKAVHTQGSNFNCVDTPHKGLVDNQDHITGAHSHPLHSDHSPPAGDVTKTAIIDVVNGDNIHASNYEFGGQRRVTLYANNKQVANVQSQHGGWVNYTVDLSQIPMSGGIEVPEPTYLEELHKLDNYSKAQYIPQNLRKDFTL